MFDGSMVTESASSKFKHVYTTLGDFNGKPIAVAGYHTNEVEHFENDEWSSLQPIPDITRLHEFSTSTVSEILYVFGGADGMDIKDVVWSYTGVWGRNTELLLPRMGHRSIKIGATVFHVGGRSEDDHFM